MNIPAQRKPRRIRQVCVTCGFEFEGKWEREVCPRCRGELETEA